MSIHSSGDIGPSFALSDVALQREGSRERTGLTLPHKEGKRLGKHPVGLPYLGLPSLLLRPRKQTEHDISDSQMFARDPRQDFKEEKP